MDILRDPGKMMNELIDFLSQRSLIAKCLKDVDAININLPELIMILGRLCSLDSKDIVNCLKSPSD